MVVVIFLDYLFAPAQNYYYQIINIDEIGSSDKTAANSSQLQKMLLGTPDVTNEMKKLLITNPNQNATESQPQPQPSSSDAPVKSDVKPNVSTTSSSTSPPTAPPKSEQ